MTTTDYVDALIQEFERVAKNRQGEPTFSVSRTISALAVLYEKARNAVEFRDEHLIRRAAIERILKRRMLLNGDASSINEYLLTELLWARYVDSSVLTQETVSDVERVISRYILLRQNFSSQPSHAHLKWENVIGVASAHIEETLVPAARRTALIHFFYQTVRPKIILRHVDEKTVNIQTYVAVERAYAQSDDQLLSFHLIQMLLPRWGDGGTTVASALTSEFLETIAAIRLHLRSPLSEKLYLFVRRQTPPFFLLRDLFLESGTSVRSTIVDQSLFEQKLTELASRRYQEIGAKVRRAVVRSIIYIFLTKMLFALALEAPYDLYIAKKITALPLIVNTLFPPVLLFLVAGLSGVPGQENTRRLVERVKKIVYHFSELADEKDVFTLSQTQRRPVLRAIFSILYLATFAMTFGLIHLLLKTLSFNVASQVIFVFFIALVSFFAYRIRQSAKEYEIVDRAGLFEPVMDFFFLPILRAGHILSREIAKLNVFIFFFDFILEAPLKVIFEVAEEWIRFIRTKKEEII